MMRFTFVMVKGVGGPEVMTGVKGLACDNKYQSRENGKVELIFLAPTCAFCQIKPCGNDIVRRGNKG